MIRSDKPVRFPEGCIAALGTFDGVHEGHRQVLAAAGEAGLPVVVVTSAQNPQSLLHRQVKHRIFSTEQVDAIFESLGVAAVIRFDFAEIRPLSPTEYLDGLVTGLNAKGFACGFNFRFGKGASGNADTLRAYGKERGLSVSVTPPVLIGDEPASSTRIRAAIAQGDMALADVLLGAPYRLEEPVIHGDARGRTLGFPTANQAFPADSVLPKFGVYATEVSVDGVAYPAVTNVGIRPTYRSPVVLAETFLSGFDGDLYGRRISVVFKRFLRPERRFASPEELIRQMTLDLEQAKRISEIPQ